MDSSHSSYWIEQDANLRRRVYEKERYAKYYQEHAGEIKQKRKEWRKSHKNYVAESHHQYYVDNKERISEYNRNYYYNVVKPKRSAVGNM